ncbi:zinc finger protein 423-like [Ostrinia furnacalis]|uniref:zinc finger protein 423-like n=1 Tax=Ostrinia furnacalis TaxID=93504 RepID=UPI001038A95B|nr:zinc finger protein 423-like [Ostrinia furnacalis]
MLKVTVDLFFSGDKGLLKAPRRRANIQLLLSSTNVIPFRWKNLFMCFYCGKHTNEPSELRKHTESHGNPCLLMKFRGTETAIKLDISNLTCKLCKTQFLALDDVIDHLVAEHEVNYTREIFTYMQPYDLARSKCPECSESFVYYSFLIKHVEEAHPPKNFICAWCQSEFSSEGYLETHKLDVHEEYKTNNGIMTIVNKSTATPFEGYYDGKFNCYSCTESYKDFGDLRDHHLANHSEFTVEECSQKPLSLETSDLKCRECSSSHDDVKTFVEHLKSVHEIEISEAAVEVKQIKIDKSLTFTCCMCDESFDKFMLLTRHLEEHSRAMLCDFCGAQNNRHKKSCKSRGKAKAKKIPQNVEPDSTDADESEDSQKSEKLLVPEEVVCKKKKTN